MKKILMKSQGFIGQKVMELQKDLLDTYLSKQHQPVFGYFTKAGYYPNAKNLFMNYAAMNEDYIFIYCVDGYGRAQLYQKTEHLSPGDFVLIPSLTSFSIEADELKPWSIFLFHFRGEGVEEMIQFFLRQFKMNKGYLPYHEERIKIFNKIYESLQRGYGAENLSLMNMALLNLVSSLILVLPQEQQINDKEQIIVNSSIQFLKENLSMPLKLSEIAENVNLSVSHFCHVFKKRTGLAPMVYFTQIKMDKARNYLKFTDLLVKEIAFKLGMDDIHYFTRIFTKTYGISPIQYRKSLKI